MSSEDNQDRGPPSPPHNPASDRAGWIAMVAVALLGALVLGWAATLSAG